MASLINLFVSPILKVTKDEAALVADDDKCEALAADLASVKANLEEVTAKLDAEKEASNVYKAAA